MGVAASVEDLHDVRSFEKRNRASRHYHKTCHYEGSQVTAVTCKDTAMYVQHPLCNPYYHPNS